jgi:hypothetical protein
MFKRMLIGVWVVFFLATASLLLFPTPLAHLLSPTILLIWSAILILVSVAYVVVLLYRRITSRTGTA